VVKLLEGRIFCAGEEFWPSVVPAKYFIGKGLLMSSSELLEWFKAISTLVCSWPTLVLLALFIFRRHLRDLIKQFTGPAVIKAKVGPVEIERELNALAEKGKLAVDSVSRLTQLMAESRLLELEITQSMFGTMFSAEQRQRMQTHIDELRKLTQPSQESQ
jgi:hypothetical protein